MADDSEVSVSLSTCEGQWVAACDWDGGTQFDALGSTVELALANLVVAMGEYIKEYGRG